MLISKTIIKQLKSKTISKINHEFIDYTIDYLTKYNLGVEAIADMTFHIPETGYFSPQENRILIDLRVPEAFLTYVHEFCHVQQYIRDVQAWLDMEYYDDFLDSKISELERFEAISAVQACERDCEQRVIKYAKQGKIEIDIPSYYIDANIYILLYDVMRITKKWPLKWVTKESKIKNMVPNNKLVTNISSIPHKHEFIKQCIKELYP